MNRQVLVVAAVLEIGVLGCHRATLDVDAKLDVRRLPRAKRQAVSPPAGNNWSVAPRDAERLFASSPIDIVSIEATQKGVSGAYKAKIRFPRTRQEVEAKWKTAPAGTLDSWNNTPRKEIAAYVVQRWFLDPRDYIVPTVALACVPVKEFQRLEAAAAPSLKRGSCVLGALSLWLQHVEIPGILYDPERFGDDYNYAYHLANFNVLAYLIQHRDGRESNILVADDQSNRRVFSVDNGISFGGLVYNFLSTNWDVIRVPAVPRATIRRLRAVNQEDLASLGTLVELAADRQGVLRPVQRGTLMDPNRGVRIERGRVQIGLTIAEIGALVERLAALLRSVDEGKLAVF
jgi:hypothetical protein